LDEIGCLEEVVDCAGGRIEFIDLIVDPVAVIADAAADDCGSVAHKSGRAESGEHPRGGQAERAGSDRGGTASPAVVALHGPWHLSEGQCGHGKSGSDVNGAFHGESRLD